MMGRERLERFFPRDEQDVEDEAWHLRASEFSFFAKMMAMKRGCAMGCGKKRGREREREQKRGSNVGQC